MLKKADDVYIFDHIGQSTFLDKLKEYDLIGIGENPHGVSEYYDFYENLLDHILENSKKTLVIMERSYPLNDIFQKYLEGSKDEFLNYTIRDTDSSVFYGARQFKFFNFLAKNHTRGLVCKFVNTFSPKTHSKLIELAKSYDLDKFEKNLEAMDKINENDFSYRDKFILNEIIQSIENSRPDRIILFLGSMHIRKDGGTPNGVDYTKSEFGQILNKFKHLKGISCSTFSLEGFHKNFKRDNGKIIAVKKEIPKLGKYMEEFKCYLKNVHNKNKFCALLADMIIDAPTSEIDFNEWKKGFDYIISLNIASADGPLNWLLCSSLK